MGRIRQAEQRVSAREIQVAGGLRRFLARCSGAGGDDGDDGEDVGVREECAVAAETTQRETAGPEPLAPMRAPMRAEDGGGALPIRLSLPYPPSVNHYWRSKWDWRTRKVRVFLLEDGRNYRMRVTNEVCRARIATIFAPVRVSVRLHPPDRRRRDIDNPCKALFDALTHAGVWRDDSQIRELHLVWAEGMKGGKVEIAIDRMEQSACINLRDTRRS